MAIAIDATVTLLVPVPATVQILAEWNRWLPGWLGRILPAVAHNPAWPLD